MSLISPDDHVGRSVEDCQGEAEGENGGRVQTQTIQDHRSKLPLIPKGLGFSLEEEEEEKSNFEVQ